MNVRSLATVASLSVLVLVAAACGSGGSTPAPQPVAPTTPTASGGPEPPSNPDIDIGQGGFTLRGNTPTFSGSDIGSAAFGTVSTFRLELSGQTAIDVTRVDLPFGGGTLSLSGSPGNAVSWSLAGVVLSTCTDNCGAYTLPTALQNLTVTAGTNFSYWTPGATSPTSTSIASLRSVKVNFQ